MELKQKHYLWSLALKTLCLERGEGSTGDIHMPDWKPLDLIFFYLVIKIIVFYKKLNHGH